MWNGDQEIKIQKLMLKWRDTRERVHWDGFLALGYC